MCLLSVEEMIDGILTHKTISKIQPVVTKKKNPFGNSYKHSSSTYIFRYTRKKAKIKNKMKYDEYR